MSKRWLIVLALTVTGCVPRRDLPLSEIPKVTKLDELMFVQATIADPQFKKIGASHYRDGDWAAFDDLALRLEATGLKLKDFSKGPEFDALALKLRELAAELGVASRAKNSGRSSQALADLKATCKTCHSKFR